MPVTEMEPEVEMGEAEKAVMTELLRWGGGREERAIVALARIVDQLKREREEGNG